MHAVAFANLAIHKQPPRRPRAEDYRLVEGLGQEGAAQGERGEGAAPSEIRHSIT